jgi:hypothetical protein
MGFESVVVGVVLNGNSRGTWPDVARNCKYLIFTAAKQATVDAEAEALQ